MQPSLGYRASVLAQEHTSRHSIDVRSHRSGVITSLTITISWLCMEVPEGSSSILLPRVIQINAGAEVLFLPDYKTERK